jgi:hypothetical protein
MDSVRYNQFGTPLHVDDTLEALGVDKAPPGTILSVGSGGVVTWVAGAFGEPPEGFSRVVAMYVNPVTREIIIRYET